MIYKTKTGMKMAIAALLLLVHRVSQYVTVLMSVRWSSVESAHVRVISIVRQSSVLRGCQHNMYVLVLVRENGL